MNFWRQISPRRAANDFAHEWRQPTPYRWRILGVAIAATFALMMLFIPDSERIEPRPPQVTYITSWAADRTQAEIIASNIANQRRKEERAAQLAEIEERRKEMYRTLGRATGIDVDAMEADIQREQAAEQAAAKRDR